VPTQRNAVPGNAQQPYSQHVHAAGEAGAAAALNASNTDDSAKTLFSTTLKTGDFLFVPRGWLYEVRSTTTSHSGLLIAKADSERYSIGRFLQVRTAYGPGLRLPYFDDLSLLLPLL
jgi:hypothetical protein